MAVREIAYCGEPVLRRKAQKVRNIDERIRRLIADMKETMGPAAGMGLAAPQVGESTRVITLWRDTDGEETVALVNPRIVETEGEEESFEGCLSLPTLRGIVLRPSPVVVAAVDEDGEDVEIEGEGIIAHCLAHEIDHLHGRLFIDLAEPDSLRWMRPDPNEESGYRFDPTTLDEAIAAFERLIAQKMQRKGR
ncbi:MAG: peptide deformylase [Armatimonadetes bacterium]|nr:peptide deformylase [Armatimonadota bacterium]